MKTQVYYKRKIKYMRMSLVLLAGILLPFVYGQEVSRILVKVNNTVITSRDIDDYCRVLAYRDKENENVNCDDQEYKAKLLVRLIEDRLVLDEAKREKTQINQREAEDKYNEMMGAFKTRDNFEKSLIEKGLTVTMMREKIADQLLIREVLNKHVWSQVAVSPQEISTFYAQNPQEFSDPEEFVVWVARSEDTALLEEAAKALKESGDVEAEKKYPALLIPIKAPKVKLKEGIAEALDELTPGNYLIRKIGDETHLVYLKEIIPSAVSPLEKEKESINNYLKEKKAQELFLKWVAELKAKAVIKRYEQSSADSQDEKGAEGNDQSLK